MRKLRKPEVDLITFLLKGNSKANHFIDGLPNVLVEKMKDGGMGSLRFVSAKENRLFGEEVAEISLQDIDGMPVFISINLDQDGDIFELDVFKGDFSPLKQFPVAPYS